MDITLLPKKSSSRLIEQDTYKVICNNHDKYIRAIKSFKSGSETGSGENEFVHVALGVIKKFKKPCVIKVHYTDSFFTKKELKITEHLKECKYVVPHICNYSCLDDKKRWMEKITQNTKTCSNGSDKLTFIIMPYIEGGDISDFLKNADRNQTKSIFLLSAFAIVEMAKKYGVSHGDLNSGNLLVQKVKRDTKTFKIGNEHFTIDNHGIHPLFIDFGRGTIRKIGSLTTDDIVDDILTLFDIMKLYISDVHTKEEYTSKISEMTDNPKIRIGQIFKTINYNH
jgi:tRNA A-37 threonylcarbamoyl transferase component Bud32